MAELGSVVRSQERRRPTSLRRRHVRRQNSRRADAENNQIRRLRVSVQAVTELKQISVGSPAKTWCNTSEKNARSRSIDGRHASRSSGWVVDVPLRSAVWTSPQRRKWRNSRYPGGVPGAPLRRHGLRGQPGQTCLLPLESGRFVFHAW
jgi:hypothetical protein